MERLALLRELRFGAQVAEQETDAIAEYFVKTDLWNRMINGEVDIIRGEKGAGKSAIYLLLEANRNELFDKNVFLVSAESPRGTTVFKDLIPDPPTSEQEFVVLWKIYLVVIIAHTLRDYGVDDERLQDIYAMLEEAQLLESELNLAGLLRTTQNFVRRILRSTKIEAGVELNETTGAASGIIGRLSLAEPTSELRGKGITSIDGLYRAIDKALRASDFQVWVALDRLDVAFADNHDLEANALRALIRVYGDFQAFDGISLKIFLREDIWRRITERGFREASHITRYESVTWNENTLLNLLMRRILSNEVLLGEYGIDKEAVLSDVGKQNELFNRLFPKQVEQGPNKPTTFRWMLSRCRDASGRTAPRELVHLLNCLRSEEIQRLELGQPVAPDDQLFDRIVFKQALPEVSETRLNTYLYAEYPDQRRYVEKLEGQKSEQTVESLAEIWNVTREKALEIAGTLTNLGFFEKRGDRSDPTYWVPFLYRDALNLKQGQADSE